MKGDALIIFAKLPQPGGVKTRLGQSIGMEQAAKIYKEFAEHAFCIAEELSVNDVAVHLYYEPMSDEESIRSWVKHSFCFTAQRGTTLGERMRNAFHDVLERGAKRAVIIGTDVPELEGSNVADAFALLDENDIVVGPSVDGGYYLLGMKPPAKDLFDNIEWSTKTVFDATMTKINAMGLSSAVLPVVHDIDNEEDLQRHMRRTKRRV